MPEENVRPPSTEKPTASSAQVAIRFSRQARKDTKPELEIRRRLHAAGLRYRINYAVPGYPRRTIDIAFTKRRLAVFIDGCFWHGCPLHFIQPKQNAEWWQAKIDANIARDTATDAALRERGWLVVRVWEHDVRDSPQTVVQRLLALVQADAPSEQ